jgi:hypothetical protein
MIKTAEVIFRMNKYLVMGLSMYAIYRITRNLIIDPIVTTTKYLINQSRSLKTLTDTYGEGTIVITGATIGLGPAYCKTLIEAGFENFVLIDEDYDALTKLKSDVLAWAKAKEYRYDDIKIDLFYFDFDINYDKDKFNTLENYMTQLSRE